MALTLYDLSDRELLAVVKDCSDNEGLTTPQEVAEHMGSSSIGVREVTSRFSWMKRYGTMTKDDEGRWGLSPMGDAIRLGRFTKAQEKALERMGPGELVLLTRKLTAQGKGPATMARREFQRGMVQFRTPRSNGNGKK